MLDEIADREGKSSSEVIMELITEYVKHHGSGNPAFKLDQWQEDPSFQVVPTLFAQKQKWLSYYENSTDEDKVKLKVALNQVIGAVENVDFNDGVKFKKRKLLEVRN